MAARVIWHDMSSDIAAWCRDCQQCAQGKVSTQPAAPVQPIPRPESDLCMRFLVEWIKVELLHLSSSLFLLDHWSSFGSSIPCWGEKEFPLSFSGRLFKWTLLLADGKFPILSTNFLRHHRLLVNPAENQLLSTTGSSSSSPHSPEVVNPVVAVPA
jgi:hypothetical protein